LCVVKLLHHIIGVTAEANGDSLIVVKQEIHLYGWLQGIHRPDCPFNPSTTAV